MDRYHPFKPYPHYKPSGIEWLGDIPEHWEVRRLCNSVAECVSGTWGTDPNGADDLPCIRVADFDRERKRVYVTTPTIRAVTLSDRRRRLLRPGDLLLEKSGGGQQQPVGAVVLYDQEGEAVCSNFIARVVTKEGYAPTFLVFLHSALYAIGLNKRSIKQTTGIQNIDVSAYFGEHVAFPPPSEQAAIAAYLDDICGKIHRHVAVKKRQVNLLEEYRRAIIHRAVTRGLDPNVPLKPTGIEWLGDIPEHWEVTRIKHVSSVETGATPKSDLEQYWNGSIRWFTPTDFKNRSEDGFLEESSRFITFEGLENSGCSLIERDSVLVTTRASVGNVAKLRGPFTFNQGCKSISPTGIELDYLYFSLITQDEVLNVFSSGATFKELPHSRLINFEICLPPECEQKRISRYLDKKTADIDTALHRARREIALLREYRTALIAHAVTGKLDLREAEH